MGKNQTSHGKDLPPSTDKEFWIEDSHVETVNVRTVLTPDMKGHVLDWSGPYAVCTSCPYTHTVPVDKKKYDIKDGVLVKRNLSS